LQSANVAYKYGVSGPFWYASGATIQVLLFAVLAVEIKRKVRRTWAAKEFGPWRHALDGRWGVRSRMLSPQHRPRPNLVLNLGTLVHFTPPFQAPTTHTVLEIVKARWGTGPHIVFLVFCLLTNIIVTSMLILGGASVVNALTGGELLEDSARQGPLDDYRARGLPADELPSGHSPLPAQRLGI
jgi:hypothetical protein